LADRSDRVLAELRRVTKLLVLIAVEGKAQKEPIPRLSRVGFEPREIAQLLGTAPDTVDVTLRTARRASRRRLSNTGGDPYVLP